MSMVSLSLNNYFSINGKHYSPKFIFKHSNNIYYNTLLITTTKFASLCLCPAYLAQVLTCHFGACKWTWKHAQQHSVWSECLCVCLQIISCSNQLTANQTCHTQPAFFTPVTAMVSNITANWLGTEKHFCLVLMKNKQNTNTSNYDISHKATDLFK